ncbi:sulfite reductase [Thermodesulfobacterium sp. TA1]|uniref:dissimilatory sulfite reductase D family protein n=1 Tax=Thermodesulfobacterium sp. TA1 TaxID=2234087 RepID=UPI0012321CCA|nr:dissimilatory sulfite reductase D family protein [Thermodesulfobacterium sp. TA1]QER41425.1 sulfite reductase [Thermodesulfobacterium sp. TA1]
MDKEELKQKIVQIMEEKVKKGGKTKIYLKDLQREIPDANPREIKNAANELVREGKLEYFSTGSTVMFGLPGVGMGLEAGVEKPEE